MELSNSWIDLTIKRGPIRGDNKNRVGLILQVRARPDVEEYLRGLADGRRVLVEAMGDAWVNCTPNTGALEAYDLELNANSRLYTLSAVGAGLIIDENINGQLRNRIAQNNDERINLSFLRLVGIGNPDGISVGLLGAYSHDYVMKVKNILPQAVKQFLQDYLVPITVNLQIVSKG